MKNITDKDIQRSYYFAELELKKIQFTSRLDNSNQLASSYKTKLEENGYSYPDIEQEYKLNIAQINSRPFVSGRFVHIERLVIALEECLKLAQRRTLFYMGEFEKHKLAYSPLILESLCLTQKEKRID